MSSFEDRLFQDLMREHGGQLVRGARLRRRRPALAAAGVLAVLGAATVALSLGGVGSTPAYGVTQHPDGTVTVSLKELAAADQTNAELTRRGVPIRVLPYKSDCSNTASYTVDESAPPTRFGSGGKDEMTIDTTTVPAGDHAVITALADETGHVIVIMTGGPPAKGAVPSCLRGDMASLGLFRGPMPSTSSR
jgi:hypothetical protein